MTGVEQVFLDSGILGAVAVALAGVVVVLWRENRALQSEMRATLREIIPAVAALNSALDHVKREGGK